jgi:hypothetical protein
MPQLRRLLVSQDRHEIFITFATFDAKYVDYIRHRGAGESFLEMQTYGPFDIGDKGPMRLLGEIMLAFALQECQA